MKYRTSLVVVLFGVLTAVGGFIGYKAANSVPSLLGGFISGALLIASGIAMMKKSVLGYFTACLVSAFLLFFFGYRFLNSWKIAPAGVMALASLGVFIFLITSKIRK